MRTTRIFHPSPLRDDNQVDLTPGAAHHLAKVLRLPAGTAFTLFDGSGFEWPATLTDPRAGRAQTGLGSARPTDSPILLTLVQGISRGERMDWTIQKAVELGVARLSPVFTARTTVKLDAERVDRRMQHWHTIVVSACEQSGRTTLPHLDKPVPLDTWLKARAIPTLVLDPRGEIGIREALAEHPGQAAVIIGPEGGLDDSELESAVQSGCTPVRMGPRILRTETAGLVALSALQTLFGDLIQ